MILYQNLANVDLERKHNTNARRAITNARNALRIDPRSAKAYFFLGKVNSVSRSYYFYGKVRELSNVVIFCGKVNSIFSQHHTSFLTRYTMHVKVVKKLSNDCVYI